MTTAIAGRWTPGSRLMCRSEAASAAPVLPAETTASASPSATSAHGLDEGRVRLRAHRLDGRLLHLDHPGRLDERQAVRIERSASRTAPAEARMTLRQQHPRRSPRARGRRPSRRRQHESSAEYLRRLREPQWLDVPALVRLAVRADVVRALRLSARRADLHARDGDSVLRAALVAPGLRRFPLRDGHERLRSIQASLRLPTPRTRSVCAS